LCGEPGIGRAMSEELEKKLLVDKRTLKDVLSELKQWSAPATVLLSLYIPPGRPDK